MDHFIAWLEHYGYGVLFVVLFLEMVGLPLPGEMTMSYTGLMVYEGKLYGLTCILFACAGVTAGITLSYWIGYRLGKPFVLKYGSKLHMGPDKMDRMSVWFDKYGNKLIFIAYFIPGVRHITGYFAGVNRMPFRKFAMSAYPGALFWVSLFISLGKVLGPKWEKYHQTVNRYMIIFALISAFIYIIGYIYRKIRYRIKDRIVNLLNRGLQRFHTLGRVKFLVTSAFVVFVSFLFLMVGLIQDFLAHEFVWFDEVASYIVHEIFDSSWVGPMNRF